MATRLNIAMARRLRRREDRRRRPLRLRRCRHLAAGTTAMRSRPFEPSTRRSCSGPGPRSAPARCRPQSAPQPVRIAMQRARQLKDRAGLLSHDPAPSRHRRFEGRNGSPRAPRRRRSDRAVPRSRRTALEALSGAGRRRQALKKLVRALDSGSQTSSSDITVPDVSGPSSNANSTSRSDVICCSSTRRLTTSSASTPM